MKCDDCRKEMTEEQYWELDGICLDCLKKAVAPMVYDSKTGGYVPLK